MAGDELLRQLSSLLLILVRKRDTVARLGGDEFAILMEDCSIDQAKTIAETIRKKIEEFRFLWNGKHFKIGVSIGVVPITSASESISSILSAADTACYEAKDQGRNRVHIYNDDDQTLVRRSGEMQWVSRINQALDDENFLLDYQPIVPIKTSENPAPSFELLTRLQENGKIIPPSNFIPAAERYNLATKIDRWVIQTTADWFLQNPDYHDYSYLCSINLSGCSLGDEDFFTFVMSQFQNGNLRPETICFEITETAAIANITSAIQFINNLKSLGCKFALDDFGSGFSSFAYLKTLPVDYLKIDGMFVRDIVNDKIAYAMVKSINEIGQVMGMQTIAEWVENKETLCLLKDIGVDYVQGFGISKPKPLSKSLPQNIVLNFD